MKTDDALNHIRIEKEILEDRIDFPEQNESLLLNAVSKDNSNTKFFIDINRKRAILTRCTFQQRVHTSIKLVRLDVDTKPHRNPDNEIIGGIHIHVYKEGYNTSWAYPVDHEFIKRINPKFNTERFNDITSHTNTFINFCAFCNITKIPMFQIIST